MTYGLEIFQLCLATILTGAKLAQQSGLAERFVANSERYAEIAERLGRATESESAAIAAIKPLVDELDRYQFVSSPTPVREVIKALRAAAGALSRCGEQVSEDLVAALKGLHDVDKKDDFAALTALESLEQQTQSTDLAALGPAGRVVAKLIEVGWQGLFMIYYQLKDQRAAKIGGDISPD